MPDTDTSALLTRDRAGPSAARDAFFLPDLCDMRVLLGVVLSAQILALVLTMVMSPADFWVQLSRVSLFAQAVALPGCALLCMLRARLAQWPLPLASAAMLLIAGGLAVAAAWAGQQWLGDARFVSDRPWQAVVQPALVAVLVVAVALRHLYVQHALTQRLRDELIWRIDVLQARIRPHFLFNTLNTITALVRSRPSVAETALEDLADLFRASLERPGRFVTLADELALCRQYVALEALRLGARLRVEWDLGNVPGDSLLPALSLQPLIENAIYHGIETCPGGGTIRLRGAHEGGRITLTMSNPHGGSSAKRRGLALANIQQRWSLCFGEDARCQVRQDATTFEVVLVFPVRTRAPQWQAVDR